MKILIRYILQWISYATILLQVMVITSCAKEDWDWLVGTTINVVAVQETTRSGSDIQTGTFEAGQSINAYFSQGSTPLGKTDGTAITLTAEAPSGGKNVLYPDLQVYYPSTGSVDVYALYPQSVTSGSKSFSVEADQTNPNDYKASDLMWASVYGQEKTANDVNLQFAHKMAKISIDVTGMEGVLIKSVKLINTVREIALTDIAKSTRALGALASATAANSEITIATSSETNGEESLSGSVLFPPQPIQNDFIEVTTNYGTTKFSTDKTFSGGTAYKASLTITRQIIGFTTTITDWTADNGTIAVPPGSSAGLKIADIPVQDYTGSAIEPNLTIEYTLNSVKYDLVKDVDYELTFFNNVNQGTATIIINGLVDEVKYKSGDVAKQDAAVAIGKLRAIKSFTIKAAEGSISYPDNNAKKTVEYQYNQTVDNALEKNGGDGTFTYESTDPTVAKVSESGVVTILKVGTTTIKAHMADDGNYTAANAQYELEVTARKIKAAYTANPKEIDISLSYNSVTYNGQAFTPQVVVTDKGRTLQAGTHYNVAYANNTNQGTASVTIRGTGNYSNADADAVTMSFTIGNVTPTITMNTDAITLPIGFTATRLASTNFGTVTYSSDDAGKATFIDGVIRAIAEGTTTVKATVAADASNANWTTQTKSISVTVVQSYWSYSYTPAVQAWTCPLTGVYRLEAFGAQGGTSEVGGFNGGRGAHVEGQLKVTKGQTLYIYVGQKGEEIHDKSASQGGWNGGGTYTGTHTLVADAGNYSEYNYCGGGGATDFALKSAAWNTADHMNSRILVAGGGGGALYRSTTMQLSSTSTTQVKFSGNGGGGGAYVGETGYGGALPGGGGTLSSGGAVAAGGTTGNAGTFGYGGNYSGVFSAGMGGGGWYGGASGSYDASKEPSTTGSTAKSNFSTQGSGGGGSSYIYTSDNAQYYPGSGLQGIPSGRTSGDFYITPTGMTEGARSGNGEARITYMGEEE